VFTARYGLSAYIKQTRLVFKGIIPIFSRVIIMVFYIRTVQHLDIINVLFVHQLMHQ